MERAVVICSLGTPEAVSDYEHAKNASIARLIADLAGWTFAGDYDAARRYAVPPYFVPHRTVVGNAPAAKAGIRTVDDLYGGVVPHPFLATKAISHRLVRPGAARPRGWSERFSAAIADAVLPGYTAFSASDARLAARRLLEGGRVRLKPTSTSGGAGQSVIGTEHELAPMLAELDPQQLARCGIVLKRNLETSTTYSVGQIRIAGSVASYHGTQRWTVNEQGIPAYAGSDLVVVRGGYDRLLRLDLPGHTRRAVCQAAVYDGATKHYAGVIASRRNYDVMQGLDGARGFLSGVLEQGWRIGGASGAEVAALQVLRDDPTVRVVEASTFETYGPDADAPPGALVHFDRRGPEGGPRQIYTLVTARLR